MKILHLNTYDILGGAARAAYRIHTALRREKINSEMLVATKGSQDETVIKYQLRWQYKKQQFVDRILSLQKSKNPTYHSCNIFPSGIHQKINMSNADIVHLHWIGGELISIGEIRKIEKPIVWTLHDMWSFCGAEHYDDLASPHRYKLGYCDENKPVTHLGKVDIDAWVWRRKKRQWQDVNFHFVTPSGWLKSCLSESSLFADNSGIVIPNCLDTNVFQPKEKKASRDFFHLPQEKRLILFGADFGETNPLKGYHLLRKALKFLSSKYPTWEVECVVFGGVEAGRYAMDGIGVTDVGRIHDDGQLAMLYSAADVFVTASMMEAFGQTVTEAMGCGTAVVGFDIGGVSETIDHRLTGYLVEPFNTEEFAEAIYWVLEDSKRLQKLKQNAREKVLKIYSYSVVAGQYTRLYRKIMEKI